MPRCALASIILACLLLTGCARGTGESLARYSYAQIHMGVHTRVVLYAPDEASAKAAARAAFARIAALDAALSDYRQDSDLSRLNASPAGEWTPVSPDLADMLSRAREISELTGGAFDVTVGPLSVLWREARRSGDLPQAAQLAEARARVGWRLVSLQGAAARLERPGMRLDPGGIGKGLAAAEALREVRTLGLDRCLVAMAGDIAAGDPPPGRPAWEVPIESGLEGAERPVVRLVNASVSTSGDLEQFVEIGGVRYSHILDPRTGLGLTSPIAATVVAPDGALADALASAVCVLGPEEAAALVGKLRGVGVRLVLGDRVVHLGPEAGVFSDHPAARRP